MRDARQGHGTIGARGWGRVSSLCGLELRPVSQHNAAVGGNFLVNKPMATTELSGRTPG